MIIRIKTNVKVLIKYILAYWSSLSTLVCVWLSFISWDDMGINRKLPRIFVLLGIVAIALIASALTIFFRKSKKFFGDINKGLILCYGDIMKLGFPRKVLKKRIVVIPVNRCFDLSCDGNLISKKSIHGQWIERFILSDEQRETIHKFIQQDLKQRKVSSESLETSSKKAGNLQRYQPGTIVEIEGKNNVTYYLLALSKFDQDLKAHCTETEFYETLHGLIEYYDAHGQGEDLYCPIMGDHIVRPVRDTTDIINFMLSFFRFNKKNIHGKIHMVVYNKMKSVISILDY